MLSSFTKNVYIKRVPSVIGLTFERKFRASFINEPDTGWEESTITNLRLRTHDAEVVGQDHALASE